MATNIKDSCPPWKNDPGKHFLTTREVAMSAAHTVITGYCFPRKVHVTNLHLLWTQALTVENTGSCRVAIYKDTSTPVLSIAMTTAQSSNAVEGTVISGTETEAEFLITNEMEVASDEGHGGAAGLIIPIVEYEQA